MKSRILFLAGLLSLCLVATVSAQVATVEGTVVSQSTTTIVVSAADGQRTFMVDAQSSLPAGLSSGQRVSIEYQTTADNQLHALKVSPLGQAPASTTDTTSAATAPSSDATGTAPSTDTTATSTANTTTPANTMTAPASTTTAATTTPSSDTMRQETTATTETAKTTEPMTADTTTTGSRDRLPATASPLPLLALVGTLALGAGLALRRLVA